MINIVKGRLSEFIENSNKLLTTKAVGRLDEGQPGWPGGPVDE
jgi:hypothetical protein